LADDLVEVGDGVSRVFELAYLAGCLKKRVPVVSEAKVVEPFGQLDTERFS